jgi:hypothetical protein
MIWYQPIATPARRLGYEDIMGYVIVHAKSESQCPRGGSGMRTCESCSDCFGIGTIAMPARPLRYENTVEGHEPQTLAEIAMPTHLLGHENIIYVENNH